MKHTHNNHQSRNNLIIGVVVVIIIAAGIYFWRKHNDATSPHCQTICTTINTQMEAERNCALICENEPKKA